MGLIRATVNAIGGGLADQWLEVIEADHMGPEIAMAPGVFVRPNDPRNSNTKRTAGVISNGSIIHVYDGQFMMLIDGGKVIDYTAEPGYFKVDNTASPSMLNGQWGPAIKETFNRFRFSGSTPFQQKVVFINTQEIRDLKFGTPSPLNYFDHFYNAELYLRAHGAYSIRIVDPIKFYVEVGDRTMEAPIAMKGINEQYRGEFLTALQTSLTQMSVDGIQASHVGAQTMKLAEYLQDALDAKWTELRGFQIESVAIESVSFTEETQKLINIRSQGAMLSDEAIRRGYMSGSIARGMEAAGSNEGGAGQAFMGVGMGLNMSSATLGALGLEAQQGAAQPAPAQPNPAQSGATAPQAPAENSGAAVAGYANAATWKCPECGTENSGKFCTECGAKKPVPVKKECPNCHTPLPEGNLKFCPECGTKLHADE
uniref:SPFH domain-containing protein n=1 Tax=Ndongobacter massiliensis TaxID=1871025 RepID=UPI0009318A54|nr:SPFH domain-containing protein [Ndongobacter massiliensis]